MNQKAKTRVVVKNELKDLYKTAIKTTTKKQNNYEKKTKLIEK